MSCTIQEAGVKLEEERGGTEEKYKAPRQQHPLLLRTRSLLRKRPQRSRSRFIVRLVHVDKQRAENGQETTTTKTLL